MKRLARDRNRVIIRINTKRMGANSFYARTLLGHYDKNHGVEQMTPASDDYSAPTSRTSSHHSNTRKGDEIWDLCSSGAPSGLCSCRVVMRTGVSLPLLETEGGEGADERHHLSLGSRRCSRWLAVVKTNGDALTLSLCQSLFKASSLGDAPGEAGKPIGTGSIAGAIGREGGNRKRRWVALKVAWRDWAGLGYGPLQWMSHAQKKCIGALALSWVSFDSRGLDEGDVGAFLQLRPTLASVRRVVGMSAETTVAADPGDDSEGIKSRVMVRDEGRVLRVDVEAVGQSLSLHRRWSRSFGKEAWEETGLGDLLWMNWTWRRYLAIRLSQQVSTFGGG